MSYIYVENFAVNRCFMNLFITVNIWIIELLDYWKKRIIRKETAVKHKPGRVVPGFSSC